MATIDKWWGNNLLLTATPFMRLSQCANITVRNMKLREDQNPTILLEVVATDRAAKTVKVKPKELGKEPTFTMLCL